MTLLKGVTITLLREVEVCKDPFGRPVYDIEEEEVDDVLVAPATTTDLPATIDLTGKKVVYTLAIPKGDTHDWTDCRVRFFGYEWRSIGFPLEGIEENIPLRWNKKVTVELYG